MTERVVRIEAKTESEIANIRLGRVDIDKMCKMYTHCSKMLIRS